MRVCRGMKFKHCAIIAPVESTQDVFLCSRPEAPLDKVESFTRAGKGGNLSNHAFVEKISIGW